jgi:hypothetical protein
MELNMRTIAATLTSIVALTLIGCSETPTGPSPSSPRADNGGLLVISPNGGEVYHVGDTITIRFSYVADTEVVAGLTGIIDLYSNNGRTLLLQAIGGYVGYAIQDSVRWTIPDSIWEIGSNGAFTGEHLPFPTGNAFQIRLGDYDDIYPKTDRSDDCFSIIARN